ncbi:hypothetical protein CBF30_04065 [Vagococcus entomophilus]|uniref:Uncharacterized protein n=1 Tax=Vagococcus entomophilus TaxID=1160095 RepID=A0A430AJX6_9ENTE|nr:hypothetical protein CBF30_04065 [Vagococcus entomophilus]
MVTCPRYSCKSTKNIYLEFLVQLLKNTIFLIFITKLIFKKEKNSFFYFYILFFYLKQKKAPTSLIGLQGFFIIYLVFVRGKLNSDSK